MSNVPSVPGVDRLHDTLTRVDEQGRFDPADHRAIRALVDALRSHGGTADLKPEGLFGPWVQLPDKVQDHLRRWCEEEITGAMDFHPQGRIRPSLVRWLNTLDRRLEARDAVRRRAFLQWSAAALWKRPRMTWSSFRRWKEARGWRSKRPTVAQLCTAVGKTPNWLMAGYAEGVRVDPRCRGFHHDPKRNVAWGYLLGIDLVPTPTGVVCHEANLQAGLTGNMRKGYWDRDPIPEGLTGLAAEAGLKNFVWMMGTHHPIDPWFYGQLSEKLTEADLGLQVLEDVQNPVRTDLPADLPVPARAPFVPQRPDPDTLVIVARDLRAGPDVLLSDKELFAQAIGSDLQRTGEGRVRVLPNTRVPPSITVPDDPGVPNLVYKYPISGKGKGVFFLRARDQDQAISLARTIDGRTGLSGGVFQPWVCSPVLPGRRIYEFRAIILVTPFGVRFLGARRRETVNPIPPTLPEGIVEDRKPFIITGFFGNITAPRDPSLEGPIEAGSLAIAESVARVLSRGFVSVEG